MKSIKNVAKFEKNVISELLLRLVCMLFFMISSCEMLGLGFSNIACMLKGGDIDNLLTQFRVIISNYIQEWKNIYEGTQLVVCNNGYNVDNALCLVLLVSFLIMFCLACVVRVNYILCVLPVTIMIAAGVVDYQVDSKGLLWLFAGILISNAGYYRKPYFALCEENNLSAYYWVPTCLLVVLLCQTASMIPVPSDIQMSRSYNDIMSLFESNDTVSSIVVDASVSNATPRYRERAVIKLTLDKKPKSNIYLKGFHGNQYMRESRTYTNEYIPDVRQHFVQNQYSWYTDIEKNVASYSYFTFNRNYIVNKEMKGEIQDIFCNIEYVNPMNAALYMPYHVNVGSNNENVVYDSDVLYRVKGSEQQVSRITNINMWDIAGDINTWGGKIDINAIKLWEENYKDYVETYNSADRMLCFSEK